MKFSKIYLIYLIYLIFSIVMLEFALKKKDLYWKSREEGQKSIIDKNELVIKNKHKIKKLIDRQKIYSRDKSSR